MSDWAEFQAIVLVPPSMRGPVAAALRQARADALEEAAKVADYWQKNYRLGETKRVRFDRRDMNAVIQGTSSCIADDIRSLKDKQP